MRSAWYGRWLQISLSVPCQASAGTFKLRTEQGPTLFKLKRAAALLLRHRPFSGPSLLLLLLLCCPVCLSVCLLSSTRSNSVHTTSETCRPGSSSTNNNNNNNEVLSKSRRKVQPGPLPQRPATCAKAEQAKEKEADNSAALSLSQTDAAVAQASNQASKQASTSKALGSRWLYSDALGTPGRRRIVIYTLKNSVQLSGDRMKKELD